MSALSVWRIDLLFACRGSDRISGKSKDKSLTSIAMVAVGSCRATTFLWKVGHWQREILSHHDIAAGADGAKAVIRLRIGSSINPKACGIRWWR